MPPEAFLPPPVSLSPELQVPASLPPPAPLLPDLVAPPPLAPDSAGPRARALAPDPAYDAAAQERALLAMADSLILGRALPDMPSARRAPAGAARQDGEGEPTFHVTIGRLEVVAPPAEERRPRRPRPAPRMSLQDYLDRRRVGRG